MDTERKLHPDIVHIRRIDRVLLTGDLEDALWDSAQPVPISRYWSGEEAPVGRHLEARLLWSSVALYARFVCRQDEPLIINSDPQIERKTPGLWDRDVCEIFLSPDLEHPGRYFEFEAAPTGEWVDLAIEKTPDSRETDWEFHSGMKASATIGPDSVLTMISIPWEGLGYRPEAGARWRGNLTRCVGDGETRGYLAWQPTYTERPDFHVPEVFGEMVFRA
ncbi:MAG: hypothetical protein QOJ64_3193 [Acidobacteriota bacterium]|jgi:alpha-galactosidase|nr:hypothetical protein [Acidobacteriota bacterium]